VIEKVQLPVRAILDVWGLWKLPLRLMRLGWRRVYPGRGGAAIEPQKIQDSCLHLPMRSMKWRKVFRNIEQDVASATSVQRARPIYYPSGLCARMLEVQGFTLRAQPDQLGVYRVAESAASLRTGTDWVVAEITPCTKLKC
jgi:hypothetical protein